MKRFRLGCLIGLVGLLVCQGAGPAAAQSYSPDYRPGAYPTPVRNMSGLVSGYEAWQLHDIRRRAEIGRQVDLNADMFWRWSGASSYYPGAFEAWPMVPGSIWGWPAAASPPVVSGTRVPPQFDPEYAQPPVGFQPPAVLQAPVVSQPADSSATTEGVPAPPPNFSPSPEPELKAPASDAPAPKAPAPKAPTPKAPAPKAPVPKVKSASATQGDTPGTRQLLAGPRRF